MATTVFSRIKDELETILTTHLVTPGTIQAVYTYRVVDLDTSPVLVLSVIGNGYIEKDAADTVDIAFVTIAKYTGDAEAETAEQVLDDVEGKLNELFRADSGRENYQVHDGFWGAVDFYQPSDRPASPLGPGTRYAIKFMRFIAYGF